MQLFPWPYFCNFVWRRLARQQDSLFPNGTTALASFRLWFIRGYKSLFCVIKCVISELVRIAVRLLSHRNRTASWLIWKWTEIPSPARSRTVCFLHARVCFYIFTPTQKVCTRNLLVWNQTKPCMCENTGKIKRHEWKCLQHNIAQTNETCLGSKEQCAATLAIKVSLGCSHTKRNDFLSCDKFTLKVNL